MNPLKILTIGALALGLFWLATSGKASADVAVSGSVSYSTQIPTQTYGSQKTVIVVKDVSGNQTVFIEESPTIVKTHKRRPPHRRPRHGHKDFWPKHRPDHRPR
ncbi:MAG: hypothetical protein LBF38_08560 [Deltaproteobacteria bacterium]|jgi:hypothetical protein|nr:hypothetical protein [Deltaproteobacteria bacterium]